MIFVQIIIILLRYKLLCNNSGIQRTDCVQELIKQGWPERERLSTLIEFLGSSYKNEEKDDQD